MSRRSSAKTPMPRTAESTWPATTTLPNASPAFEPPVHHPTCRTSSGMASAPSSCRPTGTTGAAVPSGSTSRVGTKTAGRAGTSVPSVAVGTASGPDGAGPGATVPVKGGTTGARATSRPVSDPVADPVADPETEPADATVAASAVVPAGPSPAAASTPATARAPPYRPTAASPADRRAFIPQPSLRVPPGAEGERAPGWARPQQEQGRDRAREQGEREPGGRVADELLRGLPAVAGRHPRGSPGAGHADREHLDDGVRRAVPGVPDSEHAREGTRPHRQPDGGQDGATADGGDDVDRVGGRRHEQAERLAGGDVVEQHGPRDPDVGRGRDGGVGHDEL